jgi:hypothetical protein
MPGNIYRNIILLLALTPLTVACQGHSKAYDDAWAQCEASAIEGLETEDPTQGQLSSDREDAIRQCMTDKGFSG